MTFEIDYEITNSVYYSVDIIDLYRFIYIYIGTYSLIKRSLSSPYSFIASFHIWTQSNY